MQAFSWASPKGKVRPKSLVLLAALAVSIQSADRLSAQTRAEQQQKQVDEKAANVKEWQPGQAEQVYLRTLKNPVVKGFLTPENGWTVQFGGLYPGSGLALGPKYVKRGMAREQLDVFFSAAGSISKYYGITAGAALPHLAKDRIRLEVVAHRMDAPAVAYFGPGNDSSKDSQTRFRYENFTVDSRLGLRPFRRVLTVGSVLGYSLNNTGPGSGGYPSTETVFTPAQTPGLDRQTPYFMYGPFVQVDTRDFAGDPHRGTNVLSSYTWHNARDYSEYSFRRLRVGAEQYIPFFNDKRTIVLRAAGLFSYTDPGKVVPFYQQQTIGGPDDVRGLARFRYYGGSSLVGNVEYRWEVATGLGMALFADAGRVSDKPGQLALGDLHGAGGIGLRFKSRNAVAMRIDVGFSPQGVQFWWTFSDAFKRFFPEPF
ncbi:MAG: BamA/TamA family outer membrane protein [Bryobacteraceae bacterium]|nr:BamA/TamA family outer membrane protein [Bryobacteraceae bacterium]